MIFTILQPSMVALMQQVLPRRVAVRQPDVTILQGCKHAAMQAALAPAQQTIIYRVHVRNTGGRSSGVWATYARRAREGAGMTRAELAERLGKDHSTIYRWETGSYRPDSADTVAAWASAVGVPLDEALAAAGLRPDLPPPQEPTQERDEEIDLIRSATGLTAAQKRQLIERVLERREEDRQRRIADLRWMLERAQERRGDVG